MRSLKVELPHDGKVRRFKVYGSSASFIKHCRKHIVNRLDCWSVILNADLVEKARTFIDQHGSKEIEKAFKDGCMAELYNEVADRIEKYLESSVDVPRYCVLVNKKGKGFHRRKYLFLSDLDGMMVVVGEYGTIRTAYVPAPKGYSRNRWIECSWRSIVRKMHAAMSSENEEVLCVTRETWKDLVRPRSERSRKYSRMIDEALGTSLSDPEGVR